MRLILDANGMLNPAILRGVDHDEGWVVQHEGKDVQVNSAQYGVDGFFDKFVQMVKRFNVAPRQIVCVWDGKNSKIRRRTFLPNYKVGRDKAPAVSEQLNIARDRVSQMLLDLGCHVVHQDGLEADDVVGYLCKNLRTQRNTVVTGDGDLSVLVDENTDVWKSGSPVWADGTLNKNPFGHFPHRFITLYKAIVGDTGDKIPGAKGFGDAKFVDLVRTFGIEGLEALEELILSGQLGRLREDLDALPCLKHILDDQNGVNVSWRVASLMIDAVNTKERPVQIRPGLVKTWGELADDARVEELKDFYATRTLVHAGNFEQVKRRFSGVVNESPFVAMDIETSTGEQSDEWIQRLMSVSDKGDKKEKVDTLGSELTGMGLTFGFNTQHTIYMTVDHKETDTVKNITDDQCRSLCELIPHRKLHTVIHNRAFEFPVLYKRWGAAWKDNGWHGFWPNAIDTMQGASYTDENVPLGLKERSKHHFGYEQQTYDEVTTIDGVKHKMRELTAEHVFGYGADDPACTAALHTHFQLLMEMEGTWQLYLDVEQKPEYLTSLAFVQGVPISLETLTAMETRDEAKYADAWVTLRKFLMRHGWAGTTCPEFEELTPAAVKEAVAIVIDGGEEFTSKKRKLDALAMDIRDQFPDNGFAGLLATQVENNALEAINALVKEKFTGEPKINFGSPKQIQNLFYRVIKMPPRLVNPLTENERADPLKKATFAKRSKAQRNGTVPDYTPEELEVLIGKASTDDDSVDMALKLDAHLLTEEQTELLKAFKVIKTVMTRRSLYYKNWKVLPHWSDGRIHSQLKQSRAVTRRYSASAPNVTALPKRGEGVEFRQVVLPHKKGAVVGSEDFSGQELRLMAHLSGDAPLTSCYVGDNLRHPHVLLAVEAAPLMWEGATPTYEQIQTMRQLPKEDPAYLKAKTLYEDSKTTNFATQYDAQAYTVSIKLLSEMGVAQKFIDAKDKTFPGIVTWKDDVRKKVEELGYATTIGGGRRHLAYAFASGNKWDILRAGRQGPNAEIQGSAGEMTKLAMVRVWDSGVFAPGGKYDAVFYFPVHDELVFSAMGADAPDVCRIVNECMTAPYFDMKIPIIASISVGRNYGEQIECGDEFDEKAVRKAVEEALSK